MHISSKVYVCLPSPYPGVPIVKLFEGANRQSGGGGGLLVAKVTGKLQAEAGLFVSI
jgi:hypothetical protein